MDTDFMTHRLMRRRWGDPYSYSGRWPPPATKGAAAQENVVSARQRGGGFEYGHYLIPRDNALRPGTDRVRALVAALTAHGYLAATDSTALQRLKFAGSNWSESAAKTGATLLRSRIDFNGVPVPLDAATVEALRTIDYRLLFPIRTAWTAGLKLPLDQSAPARRGEDGPGYDIEVHSLNDYVHITSEMVGSFPTVDPALRPIPCKVSGTNLRYTAPRVDNMFDRIGDRVTHTCPTCSTVFRPQERSVRVTDGWTGDTSTIPGGITYRFAVLIDCGTSIPAQRPYATPEFKALCEQTLGTALYEVGTSY